MDRAFLDMADDDGATEHDGIEGEVLDITDEWTRPPAGADVRPSFARR